MEKYQRSLLALALSLVYISRMRRSHGFTLLEISIALTIVALVIGGILTGRSLVRGAEIRTLARDLNNWQSAVGQFRDKYKALPGDFNDAVRFWGAAAGGTAKGTDAACLASYDTNHEPKKATCNGNGNGRIQYAGSDWHEVWRAWQHLSNAGMIEGVYTGEGTSAPGNVNAMFPYYPGSAPTVDYYRTRLTYAMMYQGNADAADSNFFIGDYGHIVRVGADSEVDTAIIAPYDMHLLDSKIDDGMPATGNIRSYKNIKRPNCATSDDPVTAEYQSIESNGCNIIFLLGMP